MSRSQRKSARAHYEKKNDGRPVRKELEEIFPPKEKTLSYGLKVKSTAHRSCFICPAQEDFGQLTSDNNSLIFSSKHSHQECNKPKSNKMFKNLLGNCKVETSSRYINELPKAIPTHEDDASQWQNLECVDDVDKYVDNVECIDEDTQTPFSAARDSVKSNLDINNVCISEVPRVKIIAEKYTKFKKNNIELRKLDEKVVCVEYDIFNKIVQGEPCEPAQKMRLFFSIKPVSGQDGPKDSIDSARNIPSNIKRKFNISNSDLQKLNLKEIEIIDAKITENKPYLDDLKEVLKRKKAFYMKKNKSTLDLMSLYKIAHGQHPICDQYNSTDILSQAELEELKDLILKQSTTNIRGINRRTFDCVASKDIAEDMKVISETIVAELLRE